MYLAERLIDGGGRGYRYKNIRRTGNARSPPLSRSALDCQHRLMALRLHSASLHSDIASHSRLVLSAIFVEICLSINYCLVPSIIFCFVLFLIIQSVHLLQYLSLGLQHQIQEGLRTFHLLLPCLRCLGHRHQRVGLHRNHRFRCRYLHRSLR